MLLWLNGADSNKWEPNENYGREVMELFCLGDDPALEALTYGLWRAPPPTRQDRHPRGGARADRLALRLEQGRQRHAGAAREPDLLRRHLPRHRHQDDLRPHRASSTGRTCAGWWCSTPTTRRTSAYTLWSYFIPTPPPRGARCSRWSRNYRPRAARAEAGAGRDPAPPRTSTPTLTRPTLVKPPIVFVAGRTAHAAQVHHPQQTGAWILDGMGQVPFYPPNVSGWKQGPAFLNTNTARAYWTAADYLLYHRSRPRARRRRKRPSAPP